MLDLLFLVGGLVVAWAVLWPLAGRLVETASRVLFGMPYEPGRARPPGGSAPEDSAGWPDGGGDGGDGGD